MKCIRIISLILVLSILLSISVHASPSSSFSLTSILDGASNFRADPSTVVNDSTKDTIQNFTKNFAGVIIGLAIIVLVIWGLFIGIQLMTGSAMAQANVKEALTPYVIGCIVVFGGWTIWAIFVQLFENI